MDLQPASVMAAEHGTHALFGRALEIAGGGGAVAPAGRRAR
jgi:hypothetical protein